MSTDTLVFKRGEDPTFGCVLTDEELATPLNITGYAITAEVWFGGARQLELTVANGGVAVSNAAAGAFSIIFTEAQTATLPLGRTAFVKAILVSPTNETLIAGPIYLELPL